MFERERERERYPREREILEREKSEGEREEREEREREREENREREKERGRDKTAPHKERLQVKCPAGHTAYIDQIDIDSNTDNDHFAFMRPWLGFEIDTCWVLAMTR